LPSGATVSPLSPFQRYRGWLSEVVAPLEKFIDEAVDPRDYYLDLQEIAEGESGSVYAARLTDKNLHKLKLPPLIKAKDSAQPPDQPTTLVAIKSVAILPSGSPKLVDLERELTLMRGLWYEHVLSMDAVYVDLVEDALWIRMELMERSLADLIELVASGLMLHERMMARFASDVCSFPVSVEYYNLLSITGIASIAIFRAALDRPPGCPV
jgi:p21-activated kinase 1